MGNIYIKVIPGASVSHIVGWEGDLLKIKVKAPPRDGRATQEALQLLATYFKVPKNSITILTGERCRKKLIHLHNI